MSLTKTTSSRKPFKVIILGSGTVVPSLSRSACAALAVFDDVVFLLDSGPGTMRRLLEAGFSIFDVTHMGLSHLHPDHSGELVSFLFANKYPDASLRQTPLTLIGAKGMATFFEQLKSIYGEWIDLNGKLELVEMDNTGPDEKTFGRFVLQTAPVRHRPESIAFRINGPYSKSIVYSGDTDVSENLVELANGADLLICEAAFPDELKVEGHLTPSLAGKMATRAGVGRLVLTHFYPPCEQADMTGQCRTTYAGPLELARDLLSVDMETLR